jgi:hypothetical protein
MQYRAWCAAGMLVALAQGGCGSNNCSGTYNCPAGVGEILIPANLPAPISSVATQAPCQLSSMAPYTGPGIFVYVNGTIAAGSTVSCKVQVQLSDGAQLEGSIVFQPLTCCPGGAQVGSPSTLMSPDAGAVDAASGG